MVRPSRQSRRRRPRASARASSPSTARSAPGYAQQWNASVQRELTTNTVVEVAYVGSIITHVGVPDTNLNQLTVEQLARGSALLARVPNPFFGTIPRSSSLGDPTITVAQLLKPYPAYTTVSLYRNNVGTTRYQGLEVSLRRRFARGLSFSAAYTRSKLVDDASSVFDASILTGPIANYPVADSFNRRLERDYSTGDIPHIFVSSLVWDLPAGAGRARQLNGLLGAIANDWTLTSIVTLQSGVPVAVTQVTNFNAFAGFGVQRPNLVGNPTLPDDERTPTHWFNTAAFAAAPQFALGSASRNPVRGPSYRNVDLALMRRVPVVSGSVGRISRRGVQSPEHAAAGGTGRRPGRGQLRHDHHSRRPARRAARAEALVLDPSAWPSRRHWQASTSVRGGT